MVEHRLAKARVEGSNPFSRSNISYPDSDLNPRQGVPKGVTPFRGEHARGLAPSAGVSETFFRVDLRTESGSNPFSRSKLLSLRYHIIIGLRTQRQHFVSGFQFNQPSSSASRANNARTDSRTRQAVATASSVSGRPIGSQSPGYRASMV